MNINIYPLLISFLAGISTLIGIIPTYLKINSNKLINFSLAFSAGIMTSISLFSLIPESFKYLNYNIFIEIPIIIIEIFLGIYLSKCIDIFINNKESNHLKKVNLITIIALVLHNIPEGIITYLTTSTNFKLGLLLAIGISLHNIPEGLAIAIPMYFVTKNHKKVFFYTLVSGFSELLGALLAALFLTNLISTQLLSLLLAITSGIMLFVSLEELLKTALKDKTNNTYYYFILGLFIMHIISKII